MIQDFNIHTHTYRCGHAVGTDEEYVLAAIEAGYRMIGFSDHAPYRNISHPRSRMDWDRLEDYIQCITELKEKYRNKIDIRLGLESEFYPEFLEERKELAGRVEYMLLGQHYSEPTGKQCNYFKNNTEEQIMEYGKTVCQGLETGLFTYLAHPDVFLSGQTELSPASIAVAHMIAEKAQQTDTPLEINIRGVMKGYKPFAEGMRYYYPNHDFWKIVSEYDVSCVIGIDAHDPKDLLMLDEVENGYNELKDLNLKYLKAII